MPQVNAVMGVRYSSPEVSIIDIEGDISASTNLVLTEAYTKASTPTTRVIILNFLELAYMNSSGIGLLVTLLIKANRQKQQVLAYGLSSHYCHIFQLTRISDVIKVYATESEALAFALKLL